MPLVYDRQLFYAVFVGVESCARTYPMQEFDWVNRAFTTLRTLSIKVENNPDFSAKDYFDSKASDFGYRPVCAHSVGTLWTYSHIAPEGALVPFDELPALIRCKIAALSMVEPFVTIPGVGMRLAPTATNSENYWLAMHEPESEWSKQT